MNGNKVGINYVAAQAPTKPVTTAIELLSSLDGNPLHSGASRVLQRGCPRPISVLPRVDYDHAGIIEILNITGDYS